MNKSGVKKLSNPYLIALVVLIGVSLAVISWYMVAVEGGDKLGRSSVSVAPPKQEARSEDVENAVKKENSQNDITPNTSDAYFPNASNPHPLFQDTPVGKELSNLFILMNKIGPNADTDFEEALAEIKEKPQLASEALIEAYVRIRNDQQTEKYMIMFVLGLLEFDANLNFMVDEINSPLPDFESGKVNYDVYQSSLLIKLRAVSGVKAFADQGNAQARQYLYNIIEQTNDTTLRKEAAIAYLGSSENKQADKNLLLTLWPEELALLDDNNAKVAQQELESIARQLASGK